MPWISALVLLPLLGALSMLIVPEGPGGGVQARIHAILAAGGTLVLMAIVIGLFDRDAAGLQFIDHVDWAQEAGLSWDVGVDGISLWLLALTAAMFALAIMAACWRLPERPRAFLAMLLLAEAGLMGLFAAGDLVLFYVFWEAMLIPFYFLIGMWGGEGRSRATTRFVIYTMVGSLLMLVSIVATAFVAQDITGNLTFSIRELSGVAFSDTQSTWIFAGFALAFAIKLPLWPFHGWLPDAYRLAPILVTGLLAAVMSKAGVYGFLRIGAPGLPRGRRPLRRPDRRPRRDRHRLRLAAGLARARRCACWSPTRASPTSGFIILGIVAFDVQASQGAVLQMVNHGIVVAAAFAIVAVINRTAPDDRIDGIGGLAEGAPRLAGVFLIVSMASLAIPGSNSFAGRVPHPDRRLPPARLARRPRLHRHRLRRRLHAPALPVVDERPAPRRHGLQGRAARAATWRVLLPLVAAMLFIALWPKAIVGATTASIERAVAPAQVAADRPEDQIRATVRGRPAGRGPPAARRPRSRDHPLAGRADPMSSLNVVAATPLLITAGAATARVHRRAAARTHDAAPRPRAGGHRRHRRRDGDVGRALGRPPRGVRRRSARRPLQRAHEPDLPLGRPADASCSPGASRRPWIAAASTWG